jgi:hypothetical protein
MNANSTHQDKVYEDLQRRVEDLKSAVAGLYLQREMFKIYLENPDFKANSNWFIYIVKSWYEASIAAEIRRLTDNDYGEITFCRFLDLMKANLGTINRARFIEHHSEPATTVEEANKIFDDLVGAGKTSFEKKDVKRIKEDLLKDPSVSTMRDFASTSVAHNCQHNLRQLPKYTAHLDAAIDCLADLLNIFLFLLMGYEIDKKSPPVSGDWQDVFLVPWIKE